MLEVTTSFFHLILENRKEHFTLDVLFSGSSLLFNPALLWALARVAKWRAGGVLWVLPCPECTGSNQLVRIAYECLTGCICCCNWYNRVHFANTVSALATEA